MRSNQQLKEQEECCRHEDFHNEHDMKNNSAATHSKWNFINKMILDIVSRVPEI